MRNCSYDEFAKGYKAMSKINLEIANSCLSVDNQALQLGEGLLIDSEEMDREKLQGDS